jgi:hypothetical protein
MPTVHPMPPVRRIHSPRSTGIGGGVVHVGRAPRTRADQSCADVTPDKGRSRDDNRGNGHDEQKDCRSGIECATGSDRVGLVEEEEHGKVRERRPVDTRSPDAVEQKHEEQQRAPGCGRRPEVAGELRDDQSDAEACECQTPQRDAFCDQPRNVTRGSPDHAAQPTGHPRQEHDQSAQSREKHAPGCEQAKTRDAGREPGLDKTSVLVTPHGAARAEDGPRGEDDREESVASPLQIAGWRIGSNRHRQQPGERSAEDGDRLPERLLRGTCLPRDDRKRRAVDEDIEDAEVRHGDQADAMQAQQESRRHHCL